MGQTRDGSLKVAARRTGLSLEEYVAKVEDLRVRQFPEARP